MESGKNSLEHVVREPVADCLPEAVSGAEDIFFQELAPFEEKWLAVFREAGYFN